MEKKRSTFERLSDLERAYIARAHIALAGLGDKARTFRQDQRGAVAAEYTILLASVCLAIMATAGLLGDSIDSAIGNVKTCIDGGVC